jgi:hypothetical protein
MVILRGSMLDSREDGPSCSSRARADSLRRFARTVGCGVYVRAVAAVARQGLRVARAPEMTPLRRENSGS